MDEYITIHEAAQMMHISHAHFWYIARTSRAFDIRYLHARRAIVARDDVEAWLADNPARVAGKYPGKLSK